VNLRFEFYILLTNVWLTGKNSEYVTCGTVTKLYNIDLKVRLHSHDVKYGAGSGQQSVTGSDLSEDINSHWEIKAATGKHCKRGYNNCYS
jgi:dolichyl-phosphate-mannose--protein O-mannosyl transferase